MPLPRKKTFVVFKEAEKLGPYDERPMLPDDVHLQICLSRNAHAQPFHLICEQDTLIAVFSGTGKVEFKQTGVTYFPLEAGDHVYVPAGAPTRLLPETESVIMRYKPREPGLEGVAWYCESCGEELFRHVFDTRETFPQEGYLAGSRAFNEDENRRRCAACDAVHPPVDLAPYRWEQIAAQLRE
jgi:mannose-6-phosphate isomerase-like protein (cupin superfamily)